MSWYFHASWEDIVYGPIEGNERLVWLEDRNNDPHEPKEIVDAAEKYGFPMANVLRAAGLSMANPPAVQLDLFSQST